MDIKLSKFQAGIEANAGYWQFGKQKIGYQDTWTESAIINSYTNTNIDSNNSYTNTNFDSNVSGHYIELFGTLNFLFNKPTHKLENLVYYSYGTDFASYESNAWVANEDHISAGDPNGTNSGQNGYTKDLRIQSDYTNPINDHLTLESGVLADVRYQKRKIL